MFEYYTIRSVSTCLLPENDHPQSVFSMSEASNMPNALAVAFYGVLITCTKFAKFGCKIRQLHSSDTGYI